MLSQKDLNSYAQTKISEFGLAIENAENSFRKSIEVSYDLDKVALAIGHVRVVALLIKKTKVIPEGLEDIIISDELYNRIKSHERVALTWIRGEQIKNAQVKLKTLQDYIDSEELDRVKLLAFVMQVDKHIQWLSNYSIASQEHTIAQYHYLNVFLSTSGKGGEYIRRMAEYNVTQKDLNYLIEYGYERLEDQILSAQSSINAVRAKMPAVHEHMDKAATSIGETYISLCLNDNPNTNLDDKFRESLYPIVKDCMKFNRDYHIVGAKSCLKTIKAMQSKEMLIQSEVLMAIGRMKWHRKELEVYDNTEFVTQHLLDLRPQVDIYMNVASLPLVDKMLVD